MGQPLSAWAPVLVALVACTGTQAAPGEPPSGPPPVPVEVIEVRAVPLRDTSEYVATLRSRRSVEVRGQVEGYVSRIAVRSGDRVERGDILMRIDPRRQQAATRSQQALQVSRRANAAFWRREHQRSAHLLSAGAVTPRDFEQVVSSWRSAEAELAAQDAQVQAEAVQLKYYDVTAPWEGAVGDIPVRLGDLATPQTLLTTVDDNDMLEVYLEVATGGATPVKLGMPVEVLGEGGRPLAETSVSFVSPRANTDTQTLLVKAPVDNRAQSLRVGQFVRARVIWAEREGPAIPVLAVQNQNGQTFAWVVERGDAGPAAIAQLRAVEVGAIQGQLYPVVRGLRLGERVVVSGVQKLRPGAKVVATAPRPDGG